MDDQTYMTCIAVLMLVLVTLPVWGFVVRDWLTLWHCASVVLTKEVLEMRGKWRDSGWLNWRFGDALCIRIVPGLWIPMLYWNRKLQYFTIMLPGVGITFDYQNIND